MKFLLPGRRAFWVAEWCNSLKRKTTTSWVWCATNKVAKIQRLGGEGVFGSIFDADSMARAVKEADVVIHAATAIPTKVSSTPADWEMNDRLRREGTRALVDAAAKLGAKTYIQQSIVWVARP